MINKIANKIRFFTAIRLVFGIAFMAPALAFVAPAKAEELRCPVDKIGITASISGNQVTITNNAPGCRYIATAVYRLYANGVPQEKSYYSNIFEFAAGEQRTYPNLPVPECAYMIDVVVGNAITNGPVGYGDRLVAEYRRTNTFYCATSDTRITSYQALPIRGLPTASGGGTVLGTSTGPSPYTPGAISYTYPDPNYVAPAPAPLPRPRATPVPTPAPLPLPHPRGQITPTPTPSATGTVLGVSTGSDAQTITLVAALAGSAGASGLVVYLHRRRKHAAPEITPIRIIA
ncbi:MAG: hypothetical protein Q8Q39_00405 [bacterium]|nr:hypothetical protein [bacterium]